MLYVLTAYELNCVPSQNSHTKEIPDVTILKIGLQRVNQDLKRLIRVESNSTKLIFL